MIEKYISEVGESEIEGIIKLAERLKGYSILTINSTSTGGGVAELLKGIVPLLRSLGVNIEWKVIRGDDEFFRVTKSFHNALQDYSYNNIPDNSMELYKKWQEINANEIPLDYDLVVIHDPQPLGLIDYRKRGKWIWRCHIDISNPNPKVWNLLNGYIAKYDAMIISSPTFGREEINIPQFIITPSIDPLSPKNIDLPETTIKRVLSKYDIDPERPLIVQISRFDYAKDPKGALNAYKIAKKRIPDLQFVYAGGFASDDPEGKQVYEELVKEQDKDTHILLLPSYSDIEVNALQRAASVIIQKSIKEGFGLTVTEGMWKRKVVIGGKTGGIPLQIYHGETGYLTNSIEGAAHYIVYSIRNPQISKNIGEKAHRHVKESFLITRQIRLILMALLNVLENEK